MVFAWSLASAGATPAPAASSLPVIAHVTTTAACATVRKLSLPIAFISSRNDDAFTAMNAATVKYVDGFATFGGPTADQLKRGASPVYVPAGGEPQGDDVTYNGKSVLSAANMDALAQQIYQNLVVEDQLMDQSWKEYPAGSDPTVDALRQRAQNLIDLQRALANQYEEFALNYLHSQWTVNSTKADVREEQRDLYEADLFLLGVNASTAPSPAAMKEVSQFKGTASVPALMIELRSQERTFMPEIGQELRKCTTEHR